MVIFSFSFVLFGKQTHTKKITNKQDKINKLMNRNTIKIIFASSRGT